VLVVSLPNRDGLLHAPGKSITSLVVSVVTVVDGGVFTVVEGEVFPVAVSRAALRVIGKGKRETMFHGSASA
jgi:hypothetical protein